jgi:hypothetical protein
MQRDTLAGTSTAQLSPDEQARVNKTSAAVATANHPAAAANASTRSPLVEITHNFQINPDLSPTDFKKVLNFLKQLGFAFATPQSPPVASPNVEHHIHLIDTQPIKQAPYRQSPLKQEAIRAEIRKLLQYGLIIPSNSPWSSPVSLVPKPDGSWRMVIDYRRVNSKTRKDAYPVPLIEECLNACKDADWMSIIDIKDAYHHILMALESRGITAFVTSEGLFEWTRMPFGLANAPATFQRFVDQCLRDFIGKFCAVFFDDCLVYTQGTLDTHLEDVKTVLTTLHNNGLEASAPKCKFAYKELRFVGHIVGKGTIKPDPEKVIAVTDFPQPQNVTQLKGFLGLANYYRRFIDGFASLASPLYELLRKGEEFVWSQARLISFQKLKEALTKAPCLYAPNHRLPFILQTDASGVGISGILSQEVEGETHPVGYVSRQLNKAERNYSPTEWECLAVVWAVGQFEPFLIDKPFTIVTDHSALQWLATKRMDNKRLTRWALALQEYSYTIQHRPGKANANADALSRAPLENSAASEVPVGEERSTLVAGSREAHFIRVLKEHSAFPFRTGARIPLPVRKVSQMKKERAPPQLEEEYELTTVDLSDLELAAAEQENHLPTKQIINYLLRKEVPNMEEKDKAKFIRQCKHYALQEIQTGRKALFYYPSDPRGGISTVAPAPPRFVVPPSYRRHLLELFHSSPFGGHSGITRTLRKISARYYWEGLYSDVTAWISQCLICQKAKAEHHKIKQTTGRIPDATEPWQVISIDFAGPLETCEEFKHILLFVDHFTQYCVAVPTVNTSSGTILRALMGEIICRYGMPRHILTDRGAGFNSTAMTDLSKLLNVKLHLTSAHHPQANGKTERFVGVLKQTLTTTLEVMKDHWVDALAPAIFAINSAPSTVTGLSPYFLNHGRHPVLPGENLDAMIDEGRSEDNPVEDYALHLTVTLSEATQQVRAVHASRAEATAEDNRKLQRIPTYQEGDNVWLKDHRADTRIGGHTLPTFAYPYIGPFRVVARIGPATYIIRGYRKGEATGTQRTIHATRLHPYRGDSPADNKLTTQEVSTRDPAETTMPPAPTSTPAAIRATITRSADAPRATGTLGFHGRYRHNYAENARTVSTIADSRRPEARYSFPSHAMPPRTNPSEPGHWKRTQTQLKRRQASTPPTARVRTRR